MRTDDCDLSMGETELRRGMLAARAGLRSIAAAQLERAAASLPDDPNVWLWLAWVANSPDNTIRCLDRVLELSPGHAAATAGLMWARALSRETRVETEPPVAQVCECVTETFVPEAAVAAPEPVTQESLTTTIETASETVEAEVTNEAPIGAAPETPSDLRRDDTETNSVAVSVELSNKSADATSPQPPEESPLPEASRRRWGDLIQRDAELSTDASAWPSLATSPFPTVIADPPAEQGPTSSSRFSEPFAMTPLAPATSTTNVNFDPQVSTDIETLTSSFHPPTESTSADGRPLVMVVDDSPTVRKLVSLTLERRGYRVISAFDGVAAIKELGSCRPDLILLDINMPRLDGYRLCKLIKKHEATQTIPVVMLSGKDGMFDKLRGRLVGCSDYITKPFEADALTHKVAKYLTPTSSS